MVRDTKVNEFQGTFVDWHLKLWGESIDPSKAKVLPMPTEEDDDDHDAVPTSTAGAATTSLPPVPTDDGSDVAVPTDNPQRPTKPPKPSDATPTEGGDAATKPTGTESAEEASESSGAAAEGTNGNWVPSFLPTFGVSSRTQAWIYGSLGLIVVFCSGLGAWLWWTRRKRLLNNPHDKYEFEPLNPTDDGDLAAGGGRAGAGAGIGLLRRSDSSPDGGSGAHREKIGGGQRRGGELYDAFAGGSDDEEDLDDLLSPHPGAGIGAGPESCGSFEDDDDDDSADEDNSSNGRGGGGGGAGEDRTAGRGQGAGSRLLT